MKMTDKAKYFKAQDMTKKDWATPQFMVCYEIPGEQHILCGGMYEWAAQWLVDLLNSTGEYPTPKYGEK
jgi:hypothetical protein